MGFAANGGISLYLLNSSFGCPVNISMGVEQEGRKSFLIRDSSPTANLAQRSYKSRQTFLKHSSIREEMSFPAIDKITSPFEVTTDLLKTPVDVIMFV